jgi:hypothetical protein
MLELMISIVTLQFLITQKIKDSEVLLKNNRNAGAVYLMGYAIELALKKKISLTLGFNAGFPENRQEFNSYMNSLVLFHNPSIGTFPTQLKQIKCHELDDLLTFSGADMRVKNSTYKEWLCIKDWHPERRYRRHRISSKKGKGFVKAAKKVLKHFS